MIDFPIVDTHLHVWNPKHICYPWLDGVSFLNKPFLLADYNKACGPVKVEKMVFVQCECDPSQYEKETQWITDLAKQDPRIQGIVSFAPIEKGEEVRKELEELAKNKFVKGIRRITQFESDPAWCLRKDFVRGVQMLAEFNMSFDICIKGNEQFKNTIQLVRQCPNVNFILDHIGKPFIKERMLEPWASYLKEIASLPNTWCKLSGLVTEADFQKWTKEELKPYINAVVECFGWGRVMFGGDWPVALQAVEYPRWVETLEWTTQDVTKPQLKNLFHDNAIAFYRLP